VGYGILTIKSKKCGRIYSGIWDISLKISGIWDDSLKDNGNGTQFDYFFKQIFNYVQV